MAHPKVIGDRSTLAIMAAFDLAGYVSVPFGENTRYDLMIDNDGYLSRVQCKTGRLREGAIRFNTCSVYAHHPNPKVHSRDYQGRGGCSRSTALRTVLSTSSRSQISLTGPRLPV